MDYECTIYPEGYRYQRLLAGRVEFCVTIKYALRHSDLPAGFTYEIWITDTGKAISRSRRQSAGSTRWNTFYDLMVGGEVFKSAEHQAMDHGMRWARRQRHSDLVVKCAQRAGVDTTLGYAALRDHIDMLSGGELPTTVMDKAVDLALSYRYASRYTRRPTE